jgi:hypothetical protein
MGPKQATSGRRSSWSELALALRDLEYQLALLSSLAAEKQSAGMQVMHPK